MDMPTFDRTLAGNARRAAADFPWRAAATDSRTIRGAAAGEVSARAVREKDDSLVARSFKRALPSNCGKRASTIVAMLKTTEIERLRYADT